MCESICDPGLPLEVYLCILSRLKKKDKPWGIRLVVKHIHSHHIEMQAVESFSFYNIFRHLKEFAHNTVDTVSQILPIASSLSIPT